MKIPAFKPSKRFLDDLKLPCLVAKVKNSKLPGLAKLHIAEFKEDDVCEIYLRGKNPKKISPWQRGVLKELFEDEELPVAVDTGLKEYATSRKWGGNNYADLFAEDRQKIKKHGILPYIVLDTVVIDDEKREVILSASTVIDGNLDEHGITIYRRKDRWRFDDADYFIRYHADFGEDLLDEPETPADE